MGSDGLELVSSTPRTFRDNAPKANFHDDGSLLALRPLELSAEKHKAIVSKHDSKCHVFPSPSLQAAATILQDFDHAKLFNCLSVLRSLSHNDQQASDSESLSIQQLTALLTLKDYKNEDVVACLEACRRRSAERFQVSHEPANDNLQLSTAAFSPEFWPGPSASLAGLSPCNPCPPSFYDGANASDNTPRSSLSHANSFVDLSRENSRLEGVGSTSGTGHQHWCTVCEKPSPISTCDGWKRHEKEKHERGYMCMPNGPVEATDSGPHCAFCGLLNPSDGHLELHDAGLCADKPDKDRKYTRKLGLINHLKAHGMFEASALADRWRVWLKKRFCACGFCISIFSTNGDRLNHIDNHHYRHHQHIDDWDHNMVIRGLLLQPDVLASWKNICPWDPDPRNANLTWDPHVHSSLQQRLELSEVPAHQLAVDALRQSSAEPSQDIPPMSLPVGSVLSPQTDIGDFFMPAELQHSVMGRVLASSPSFDIQDTDGALLPFQAPNLPWDVARRNTVDPVQMDAHPSRSLVEFPGLGMANSYHSRATAHSTWHQHGVTNYPFTVQPSPGSSNIEAAAVSHHGNALGQSDLTTPQLLQGDTSHFTNSFNPPRTPQNPLNCVADPEGNQTSARPEPSPSTHNHSTRSFSTVTTMTGSAKPPSIIGHVKRGFPHSKSGIDVDDIMLHIQDDERSRSEE